MKKCDKKLALFYLASRNKSESRKKEIRGCKKGKCNMSGFQHSSPPFFVTPHVHDVANNN